MRWFFRTQKHKIFIRNEDITPTSKICWHLTRLLASPKKVLHIHLTLSKITKQHRCTPTSAKHPSKNRWFSPKIGQISAIFKAFLPYFPILDINTTVSTWLDTIGWMSSLFLRAREYIHSLFRDWAVYGNISIKLEVSLLIIKF